MTFVLVSIAQNQSQFFGPLALDLQKKGHKVAVVSFHEKSVAWLRDEFGLETYNIPERARRLEKECKHSLNTICQDLGISNLSRLFTHEQYCYELNSNESLERKIMRYVPALEEVFKEIQVRAEEKTVIFQELGGFLSVQCTYLVGKKLGIDNYFIEPSFFRGRIFFTKNSLLAPRITETMGQEILWEVRDYLESNLTQKKIVIPKKDDLRYKTVFGKLSNFHNIRRLIEKSIDKHVHGYEEEFQHTWVYVRKHLRMLVNGFRLRKFYKPLDGLDGFIYFPLHVPGDFALTVRSFEYIDQYTLLEHVAKVAPYGKRVAFKEHPSLVGGLHFGRVRDLLRRNSNLVLLDPKTNNFDVMGKAETIVTINSKSGAEALTLGKRTVVLGDAFYGDSGLIDKVENITELEASLNRSIVRTLSQEDIEAYFSQVWESSFAGEVFYTEAKNVAVFVESMCQVVTGKRQ
jgi:hypothetical protein